VNAAFKDQAFGARWLVMGDIAEGAFRRLFPNAVRTGLDRAPTTKGMTAFERYMPDFHEDGVWIEVMGIGRDQTLKLKVEKLAELLRYSADEPVLLFVWDSSKKRYCVAGIDSWLEALIHNGVYALFPEGKPYVGLHASHFPCPFIKAEAVK
jgi:hypothetical protein